MKGVRRNERSYSEAEVDLGLRMYVLYGSARNASRMLEKRGHAIPMKTIEGWTRQPSKQALLRTIKVEIASQVRCKRRRLVGSLLDAKLKLIKRVRATLRDQKVLSVMEQATLLRALSSAEAEMDRLVRLDEGTPTDIVEQTGESLDDLRKELALLRQDPKLRKLLGDA